MALPKSRRREEDSDINITPMLDVVFIMLIFFIVTATFIRQAGIDVNRPDAETDSPKPLVSVLVAINSAGEIWMDKAKVDPSAVRASIERIKAENPKGGLVIQADQQSNYKEVKIVLDAARAAGLTEVAIATED